METHGLGAAMRSAYGISESKSVSGNVPKPALPVNAVLCPPVADGAQAFCILLRVGAFFFSQAKVFLFQGR